MAEDISPIDKVSLNSDDLDIKNFDAARIEAAVRELLLGIGEDPDRDGLKNTPSRVARSYAEIFGGEYSVTYDQEIEWK